MKKILFITTRNILTTCGELRLIKNRANALFNIWGINSDVIIISNNDRINKRNEILEFTTKESIIKISLNPFGLIQMLKKLRDEIDNFLLTGDYSVVIMSGLGTMYLSKMIRKKYKNIKLIADIHGANEDILEFGKNKGILKRLRQRIIFKIANNSENNNMKFMDGVFVVTNGLKKYLEERCKIKHLNCYIAPCAINTSSISFLKNKINRETYREKYSIRDNTILFIYSGGVSPWQCIKETIELFQRINDELHFECKMLLLSHDKEQMSRLSNGNKNIIIDSYPASELKSVLCAGDYAFMIRKDCITNNVAYPNKFLEYVESGMKIIATPYVYDIAQQIEKYDIGFLYTDDNFEKLKWYIEKNFYNVANFNQRGKLLMETGFENRLKKFISDFFIEN